MSILLIALIALIFALLLNAAPSTPAESATFPIPEPIYPAEIPEIADYRRWHRLNDSPRDVSSYLYTMCRMPSLKEMMVSTSPHGRGRWLLDYVNETGLHAMTLEADPTFPPGSIIVKEKYTGVLDPSNLEALGVMIKHEQGYNPDSGDWEFIYWEQERGASAPPSSRITAFLATSLPAGQISSSALTSPCRASSNLHVPSSIISGSLRSPTTSLISAPLSEFGEGAGVRSTLHAPPIPPPITTLQPVDWREASRPSLNPDIQLYHLKNICTFTVCFAVPNADTFACGLRIQ